MLFFNLIFNCVLSVIIVLLKFSECDILNFCSDEAQLFQVFIMPTHNRFGSISRRHNLTRSCTIRSLLCIDRRLIFLTRTKHFLKITNLQIWLVYRFVNNDGSLMNDWLFPYYLDTLGSVLPIFIFHDFVFDLVKTRYISFVHKSFINFQFCRIVFIKVYSVLVLLS